MDYEEILLEVSEILRSHNRYRLGNFEHTVNLIREVVVPQGEWEVITPIGSETWDVKCSLCGEVADLESNYCPNCGARMI